MTDNVIEFDKLLDRQGAKAAEKRNATVDRLTMNILNACEVDTVGEITPIVLALEQALMALLAVSCPQFRNGFNERFVRRLPALVGWANQLADARGYCTICRCDATCEPEEISP
jgi:hypothetical protein